MKNIIACCTTVAALFSLTLSFALPVAVNAQTASSTLPAGFCYTFTRNLGEGHTLSSADANALEQILSAQGLWSSGTPITSYTDAVASAVAGFQQEYATQTLAPYSLTYGTGYIGTATRNELNALYGCSGATTSPTSTTSNHSYGGGSGSREGGTTACPAGYTCTPTNSSSSSIVISSITPTSGTTGTTVTIYGSGFTSNDTVEFNQNGTTYAGIYGPSLQSVTSNEIVFTLTSLTVGNVQSGTYQISVIPTSNYGTNNGVSNSVDFTINSQVSPTTSCPVGWTCTPTQPTTSSVNAVNHAGNDPTAPGLIWVYWPTLGSGYTYTVSASPSYSGSVETTTYTNSGGQSGVNMGCINGMTGACYSGGGPFPTNGPYTFTVTATSPSGQTVNIGTSNAELVSATSTFQPQTFTITSPSVGAVWQVGQTYNITWTGTDIDNPTNLPEQIYLAGGGLGNTGILTIGNNVSPIYNFSFAWPIPSTVQPSAGYEICMSANVKGGSGGCSQPFTIVSAASGTVPTSNASVSVNGSPTLALTYNSAQQESALTATFNVSVNGGSQGVNILDGAPAISFIDQNGNTAEVNLSNVTLVPTAGSNVSTEEDSYGQPMAIVPAGQTVNFTASATANPQQIFAGTYHAMLYAVAANPTTNINNEFELQAPPNQTNTKTIVGEIAPYITSVSPNPATVGQSMTITGQRLSGQDGLVVIYIDGQVIPAGSLTTNINGTSLTFTVPSLSSGTSHTLQLKNQNTGASNMVAFQVTNSTPVTTPVLGAVTAVNHSQNPATAQGLIYVSWPSQGSGYTYTITASPAYTGSVETTTGTGVNMGCYAGGCFNGGGAFPTHGPYTFTVSATGPNGTFTVGTSNSEMVSSVSSTAVCPAGYTCAPAGYTLTCPAGYTCTNVTANCPTGYTCQTATAISNTPTTQPSVTISSPSAGQTFAYGAPIPVTWGENYNSPTITVYLYSPTAGNVFTSPIINGTTGTTNLYTIPATAVNSIPTTGGQYEVNVCDNNQSPAGLSGKSLCSLSGTFTISPTVVSTPPPASSATVTAINHSQNPATSQGLIYVYWPSQGSGYTYTVSASPAYTGSVETTTSTGVNMGCYVGGCFNGGGAFPGNGPYTFTVTATDANGNTTTIGTSNAETVSPATTSTATTQSSSVWQSFMNLLGF